jgi:hypothetical protein
VVRAVNALAKELIQEAEITEMAHLIIVQREKRDNTDEEILLNADQILWAERIAGGKPNTNLTLAGDRRLTIRETFDELRSLSGWPQM